MALRKKTLTTAFVISLLLFTSTSSVSYSAGGIPTPGKPLEVVSIQSIPASSRNQPVDDLYAAETGEKIIQLVNWEGERANQVVYSPDGKVLVAASSVGIQIYDGHTLNLLHFIPAETWVRSLAISPDGKIVAAGYYDHTIRLWHIVDGMLVNSLEDCTDQVHGLAFSPDGQMIAAASNDDTLRLWNATDGSLLRVIRDKTQGVRTVAFSPDGKSLASGGSDGVVRLWRVSDGALLRELAGHTGWVRTVAFSPDGTLLASGSFDQTDRLWRISDGVLLFTLKGHSASVLSVAFSPDGKTLATGSVDHTIGLWRVEDGMLLDVLAGHTSFIFSVTFSPTGDQLASGSMDGTLRVWNIGSGRNYSPGVTAATWVGERASQDCRACHHPRGDYSPVLVSDISCKVCHSEGASLYWDPYLPRNPDPLTGELSNGLP